MDNLRAIRFLVYITTLAYSFVVFLSGPSTEPSVIAPGAFTSPVLGALVGTSQLLASIGGLVVELSGRGSKYTRKINFVLAVTFLYETVLEIVIGRSAFEWIPFAFYAALAGVIYLSEGNNNEGPS